MDILGTERFSESINIKPVTRGRLFDKSMIDNKLGWKELLESGDIVGVKREGEMQATQYVFLSYDDMAKFDYAKVFYLGRSLDRDMKEGIMLRRAPSGDRFFYFCVSDFSCVDGSLCVGASRVCITEICRSKTTLKQPLTREFVANIEATKPFFSVIYKKSGGVTESINIKPVTKDRLNANPYGFPTIQNRSGWKSMLNTGDVVVAKGRVWHYISENDYFDCGYDRMFGFDMITRDSGRCRDGILIRAVKNNYENVCMYHMQDDTMDGVGNFKIHISEIRRYKSLPQTLGKAFFDNESKDEDKTVVLYKENGGVTESINIKPVTKDRLKDIPLVKYESASDMRENLKTGDILIISSASGVSVGVFVSAKDLEEQKYKDIVKNLTRTYNIKDKDGCIIEKEHNYHLRRATLMGNYDDNLQSYGQKIEKVYRIPNNPLEERNFAEPLISKSVLIWSR